MNKKIFAIAIAAVMLFGTAATLADAKEVKMAYVDLRKAFYEYEKTKGFESSLNEATEERQQVRTEKVTEITKLRDEGEMLNGDAKAKNQTVIEAKLVELQNYDRETRQMLLNKKNDMFRSVIDDIQVVVEAIGKKEGYDYILDSRNIMYANEAYDLTAAVVAELNKQ